MGREHLGLVPYIIPRASQSCAQELATMTVIIDHSIKAKIDKSTPRTIYKYSKANWEKLHEELYNILDGYMSTNPDSQSINTNWTSIKRAITSVTEKHIPHSSACNDLPYMTKTIKHQIR